jgi:hypothetical protein
MLQPHFEASVRMKLTLPKMGTWSPPRLSKTQSLIAGVKTPSIDVCCKCPNGSYKPFWTSTLQDLSKGIKNKLWSKEGPGVKLAV